jgi:fucose 4-O-acetylase-like acetyltransferase
MPSRETLWFVPLLVISLLVAMSLTIFLSPAIGIPLLVIAGLIGAIVWFRRNSSATGRMEEFREQVPYESGTDFTERDRTTLTPTERQ